MDSAPARVVTKRIVLDLDRCTGCRSCGAACHVGHHDQTNLVPGRVGEAAILPVHCRHCEQPACVEACAHGALYRNPYGSVSRSELKCVGCRSCSLACPFGVIPDEYVRHVSPKCDLCVDRVERGGIPRCVATCTSGALSFVDLAETVGAPEYVGGRIQSHATVRRS
ncbi:MAG: 4Fe-4S binding protein [Planctomycetes bacterium]|jgi:Fe-S-cluster-containing dehydrogenase component|nr:4Fe-4S binding protein [Planctomycetota bacterium]